MIRLCLSIEAEGIRQLRPPSPPTPESIDGGSKELLCDEGQEVGYASGSGRDTDR